MILHYLDLYNNKKGVNIGINKYFKNLNKSGKAFNFGTVLHFNYKEPLNKYCVRPPIVSTSCQHQGNKVSHFGPPIL